MPLLGILIAIILVLVSSILSPSIRSIISKNLLRRYSPSLRGFGSTFSSYLRNHKAVVSGGIILAGLRWILFAFMSFVLFLSLGQDISLIHLISIVSISSLVSMIPLTISGLGLREGSFILLCSQIGIPVATSAAVSLLALIVSYSTVFILLILLVRRNDLSLKGFSAFLRQEDADSA